MSDESNSGIGWAITIPAAVEAAFVLLWIGSFALSGRLTSPQIRWYVLLPVVFLALPALAFVADRYSRRNGSSEGSCLAASILWSLLGINLIAFVGYLAVSSGGV
jgi:hypothetical protein